MDWKIVANAELLENRPGDNILINLYYNVMTT